MLCSNAGRSRETRLGIGRIVLLALAEEFHMGRRDPQRIVAQLADLSAPDVGATTGFHRHDARSQATEKIRSNERKLVMP